MGSSGFSILSLDGGGIRGAFAAAVLAEIERHTGKRISEHFDLIAGTSTGGLIAIALALGESAERIEQFYSERGAACFRRDRRGRRSRILYRALCRSLSVWLPSTTLDADWLIRCKYEAGPLRAALEELFGGAKLGAARTRLLVPAVDLVKGQTVVFKTSHLPGLVRDAELSAVDAALATAAAPTYFPPAVIRSGSAYADGGLWANNPSVVAVAEAVQIHDRCRRPDIDLPFEIADIKMLSIGTGEPTFFLRSAEGLGVLSWASRFLDVAACAQSQGAHFAASYFLEDKYRRVNFTIPSQRPEDWALDSVHLTNELIHIGREKGIEHLANITREFLQTPAAPYTPFSAQAR